MKKGLWVIIFFIVLFAGDRLIGWLLQSQVDNSQFRYSRMYRNQGQADILIVGNSRGLNFYQPYMEQATGKKTFSVCYYSMPSEIATVVTQDYLDLYPNVKTVLVEISIVEMSDDKLLTGFTTYMPHSRRIDSVIKSTSEDTWYAAHFSHIYRFNNEVFQRAMYHRNKLDDDWYTERVISNSLARNVANYNVSFKVPEKHVQDLKNLTDYCRKKNVPVKLVLGPFFPNYQVKNLDVLVKRVEEATGCKVYNYGHSIDDGTAFSDFLHANLKGGKTMVDLMIRDSLLPMSTKISKLPPEPEKKNDLIN